MEIIVIVEFKLHSRTDVGVYFSVLSEFTVEGLATVEIFLEVLDLARGEVFRVEICEI